MALQKHIDLDTGITLPEAYIRITEGMLSLDKGTAYIIVETYADYEARMNKKVPVFKREYKCDISGATPQANAGYHLYLENAEVGKGMKLSIDLTGDGVVDFELVEGMNVTTDGTLGTLANVIADKLNANEDFNIDYFASYDSEGVVKIDAKEDGTRYGSGGNDLIILGDMVKSFDLTQEGQDRVLSSFEKFFGIEAMNEDGTNVFKQGYLFIKSIPEFQGSIDVI